MAGKVPNLEPHSSGLRLKKTVRAYYSPYFGRWITRRGQSGNGGTTPNRQAANETFTATVNVIKNISPQDRVANAALAANTPFLDRDIAMKNASGTMIQWTDDTGTVWVGRRQVYPDIQAALDSISTLEGSILVRTSEGWLALMPGTKNQVLTMLGDTELLPQWHDQATGGGAGTGLAWATPAVVGGGYGNIFNPCWGNPFLLTDTIWVDKLRAAIQPTSGDQFRLGISAVNQSTLAITAITMESALLNVPNTNPQLIEATFDKTSLPPGLYCVYLAKANGGTGNSSNILHGSQSVMSFPGLPLDWSQTSFLQNRFTLASNRPVVGQVWSNNGGNPMGIGFRLTTPPE